MNHSETEGDGTDREMCIGQSRDGVGTKGERERKRRKTLLWRWEEREQQMHVIQLRNATRMMTDEIKSVSQLGRESSLIFHAARDGLELLPWLRILITPESHSSATLCSFPLRSRCFDSFAAASETRSDITFPASRRRRTSNAAQRNLVQQIKAVSDSEAFSSR